MLSDVKTQVIAAEEEITKLKKELWEARRTIIGMAPEPAQELLNGYIHCKKREDVFRWLSDLIGKFIAMADAKPAREMGEFGSTLDRAFCPLCGDDSDNPLFTRGFALPTGLERHLKGSYNAKECDVMKAAKGLALQRVDDVAQRAFATFLSLGDVHEQPPGPVAQE